MGRLLENEWAVRVLAVVIAVMVWFVAMSQQNPVVTADVGAVAVDLRGIDPGHTVLQAQPSAVTLTVRGRRGTVERLDRTQFAAWVDLSGLGPGPAQAAVSVVPPPGVQVVEVRPGTVSVRLDRLGRRQLRVEVALEGAPAEGYRVGAASARPSEVLLEGPEEYLGRVAGVRAGVKVAGVAAGAVSTVPVVPVDDQGRPVEGILASPGTVEVALEVSQLPPAKVLPVRVALSGQPAPGYLLAGIKTEPPGVEVRGPAEVLEGLYFLEVGPVAVGGAVADVAQELPVPVPEGAASAEPALVRVTVLVEREATVVLERVPVVVTGLAPDTVGRASPAEVAVTVRGASSLVASLDPAQVAVEVNALGLGPGEYWVSPGLTLPPGLRGRVEPATVSLRVEGERAAGR
ncbi:MAG: hypothetical protein K6T75_01735 [Acetobacteraceae bacterium]|nr:hypothetical protein [Acetobacteraceae bacterium]